MAFTPEQVQQLSAKLDKSAVKSRQQSGRSLSYIEGWHVIAEANRIFGFDAWTSETVDIRVVAEKPRKIGQQAKDGWGVSYVARVRVQVGDIVREGVGAGHGIDVDLGLAHESAIKEAETDARKRALMTFGNPFGLALYDKTQENVGTAAASKSISERAAEKIQQPVERQDDLEARIVAATLSAMKLAQSTRDFDEWKSSPETRATFRDLSPGAKDTILHEGRKFREALDQVEMLAT